jgi:hypothetical protein
MGIGVSSHEEVSCAHFVAGGAGRSALSSDAITCLSHGVVDLARGLFSGRRAALGGSHGLYRPAGQALMTL